MIRPLYLSQARLDRSRPATALAQVLDPFEHDQAVDVHHRLIWTLFADDPGRKRDFLWRNDDGQFLILSERHPEDRHALFELRTKLFEPHLGRDDRLGFRLRANAVVTRAVDGRRHGKRHDIVMDLLRRKETDASETERALVRRASIAEAARHWLSGQGARYGFDLETLDSSLYRTVRLQRRSGVDGKLGVLDLDGVLRVSDPESLLAAVANGFGKGKAFGCGLMLLRRA